MTLLLVILCGALGFAAPAKPQQAVVIIPAADVWSRPPARGENPADDLRETQVLFGEKVLTYESSGTWVRIEAVEQPEFSHHNRWEGYPGWVQASSLGMGEGPKKDLPAGIHRDIIATALTCLNQPYLWGGLSAVSLMSRKEKAEAGTAGLPSSPYSSRQSLRVKLGVDCSGLTHLSYRINGLQIPRDSLEQWMKAKPVARAQLQPGDLIFSAKADAPKKITHVALYAGREHRKRGDGEIIEAPQTGMLVRKISFKEKYGKILDEVESGDQAGERVIYFGSFLNADH